MQIIEFNVELSRCELLRYHQLNHEILNRHISTSYRQRCESCDVDMHITPYLLHAITLHEPSACEPHTHGVYAPPT